MKIAYVYRLGCARPLALARAQFCAYDAGDHFNTWHVDEAGEETYERLTLVVFVSAPELYEGGEFDLETASQLPHRPAAGSVLAFDARQGRHRVRRVSRGRRETIVLWTCDRVDSEDCVPVPHPPASIRLPLRPRSLKLVIWDLDGTLWKGALDDDGGDDAKKPSWAGTCKKEEVHCELVAAISALARRGVVSSVCSRSARAPAVRHLRQLGVWDLLVFSTFVGVACSKGAAIQHVLTAMHLSAQHALFVDDEPANRAEALLRDGDEDGRGGLSAMDPESAAVLLRDCGSWGREDAALTRLEQYRLLERKRDARQALERAHQPSYSSSGEDQTLLDAEFLKRRDDYRVSRRYISIFFLSPNLIFSRKKTGETYI